MNVKKEGILIPLTLSVFVFFLYIKKKVSCFRLAHSNILLLVQRGAGREVGATYIHKHTLFCSHGCHSPQMAKVCPIHFLSWEKKKMCKRFMLSMTHQSQRSSPAPPLTDLRYLPLVAARTQC